MTNTDDLGHPDEVAAAREQSTSSAYGGQAVSTGTTRELIAVVLLTIGWFIFGLGWVIGVVLAWTSRRWSTREKMAATLLPVPVWLSFLIVPDAQALPGVVAGLVPVVGLAVSVYLGALLMRRAHDSRREHRGPVER